MSVTYGFRLILDTSGPGNYGAAGFGGCPDHPARRHSGFAMNGKDSRDGRGERSEAAPGGDLSGRLQRLGAELEARRPAPPPGSAARASSSDPSGLARALRASSEFIAGVLVGGGLGWAFDKGLGTSPWGLIVFLLLGFVAGVFNVIRSAGTSAVLGREGGARKPDP
ncbi:AtpZ/AtpI family protein [uncultured Enterovirga sp.]|uniref:AtpZ/AtpI family protein n=1 Tax=uncultured Enterovirga sp. TaxID=2026352 RepID=UPI0035CBF9A3